MIFIGTNIIIYIPFVLLNNYYDGLNGVLIKPITFYVLHIVVILVYSLYSVI